ncbi:hypothetical protein AAMO2058_001069400 [Amorphochlora amoebiformis]
MAYLRELVRLQRTVKRSEQKNKHVEREIEKFAAASRKTDVSEILGSEDVKQILQLYLMELDFRIPSLLRKGDEQFKDPTSIILALKFGHVGICQFFFSMRCSCPFFRPGKAAGFLDQKMYSHFSRVLNHTGRLNQIHADLIEVLKTDSPSMIYSMVEVKEAFSSLLLDNPRSSTKSAPEVQEGSKSQTRPKVPVLRLEEPDIPEGRDKARSSSWAAASPFNPREKRKARAKHGARERSGYEDLVLVKPNLALYEGRKKVSKVVTMLEVMAKRTSDKQQAETLSQCLSTLNSALHDLLDEINASTAGKWDKTNIDKQRNHLSHDEQKALDFVLATTQGISLNDHATAAFEASLPKRRGSRKARAFISKSKSSNHMTLTPDSKTISPRSSAARRRMRSSSARSASPAGLYLQRHDSARRVEYLFEQTASNHHKISVVTPQVYKWLQKAESWDEFDIWQYSEAADGYPLSRLFLHYMDQHNLFQKCLISRHSFINFVRELESGYLDVPYHNNIHACDVLHATHIMLRSEVLSRICERFPLLRVASYLAAAAHDFKHPGTNNEYAKNTQSEVAIRYNDMSILESMHIAETFKLIKTGRQCNFLQCLDTGDRQLLRRFVISMVLHTDMAKHNDLVVKLRRTITTKKETKTMWLDQKEVKDLLNETEFLLNMMLHCADLANACRPRKIMEEWTKRVIKEFWAQGDLERLHGLPVGPGRDRSTANVPLGQQFFIKVLVSPLYTLWKEVIPETEVALKHLHENLEYWTGVAESKRKMKVVQDTRAKLLGKVSRTNTPSSEKDSLISRETSRSRSPSSRRMSAAT